MSLAPMSRRGLVQAHLESCRTANRLILEGKALFQDFGDASSAGRKRHHNLKTDLKKVAINDFTAIFVNSLCLDTTNKGCILRGRILVPPLIMKGLLTLIEDAQGNLVTVAIYNALDPGLKGNQLINAAQSFLKEGREIAILNPFYKTFMDNTIGIRVDDPNSIILDPELPDSGNSASQSASRGPRESAVLQECSALKDRGNELLRGRGGHGEAEKCYSAAISMLDDLPDDDAGAEDRRTLEVALTCNRSMVRLKLNSAGPALSDARRALSIDDGSSRSWQRQAEALLGLGLVEEARASFARAVEHAGAGDNKALRDRAADLAGAASARLETRVTPSDFAARLRSARPGSTLVLAPGVYQGPFQVHQDLHLLGCAGAVLTASSGEATITVVAPGRVVISRLEVLRTQEPGRDPVLTRSHALMVMCGSVTAHECRFTSAAGPSAVALNKLSHLVLLGCEIHDGAAGGLLVAKHARMHGFDLIVRGNRACGVEVREGGELELENSVVSGDYEQGIMIWCGGARMAIRGCEVFGYLKESGILCDCGESAVERCTLRNNFWGIAVQGGSATVKRCRVHTNGTEGILLQAKGHATILLNEVYENGSHGIFVGFDAVGRISLAGNKAHDNLGCGIFNGAPKSRLISFTDNHEFRNGGMTSTRKPSDQFLEKLCEKDPSKLREVKAAVGSGDFAKVKSFWHDSKSPSESLDHQKWLKRVGKLGGGASIEDAFVSGIPLAAYAAACGMSGTAAETDQEISEARQCWNCGENENAAVKKLSACKRCRLALYCSKECQKAAWKSHKEECLEHIEFPAFQTDKSGAQSDVRVGSGSESEPLGQEQALCFERRFTMMERGIALGDPSAAVAKAELLIQAKDFVGAAALLHPVAEAGSNQAQCILGQIYERGRGVPQDLARAEHWYLLAAEAGLPDAMALLGNLCRRRAAAAAVLVSESGPQTGQSHGSDDCAEQWWAQALAKDSAVADRIPRLPSLDKISGLDSKIAVKLASSDPLERLDGLEALLAGTCRTAEPVRQGGVTFDPAGLLQFHKKVLVQAEKQSTPFGEVRAGVHQSRLVMMRSAVEREGEAVMQECASYLRAARHFEAFLVHYDRGKTDAAFLELYAALYEDEKAVMYDPEGILRAFAREEAGRRADSLLQEVRARALFVLGVVSEPADAVPPLLRLSHEAPSARVLEMLGCMYGFLGEWGLVSLYMDRTLSLDPSFYIAHYHSAVACRMTSDYQGAADKYARFLAECPRDCRKRVNALYSLAKQEVLLGMENRRNLHAGRLRKLLAKARACEAELEPLWGPYDLAEKTLFAAMDLA